MRDERLFCAVGTGLGGSEAIKERIWVCREASILLENPTRVRSSGQYKFAIQQAWTYSALRRECRLWYMIRMSLFEINKEHSRQIPLLDRLFSTHIKTGRKSTMPVIKQIDVTSEIN